MRAWWIRGAPFALTFAVAASCQPAIPDYGPPGQCDPKAGPCPMSSDAAAGVGVAAVGAGGGGVTTGGGGFGGGVTVSPLTGSIDIITSPDFSDTAAPFAGAASVVVYPSAGGTFTAPYNSGGTFTFTDIPNGPAWFYVQAPSTTAWSTISPATVPAAQLVLPVIDQTMLQDIASSLPILSGAGTSMAASQIVLLITNAGAPYAGVSVTGNTGGAVVAYDTASGVYSDSATATRSAGTIILFNSALQGTQVITLTDMNMKSDQPAVLASHGAVTLVSVAWN